MLTDRIFVDTLVLGVILVLFCKWLINTQPTERRLLQCLVARVHLG
jgi:hypothetical protein